jgi:ADP-heptose:LPS heptosyltransferase
MKRPAGLSTAKSILVVKLDAMGDFVLVTPFLRELRHAAPQAQITLITTPAAHALARTCPHVNEAHVFIPDAQPRRFGTLLTICRYARFFRTTLKGRCYDFAIVPRTGPDNHHALLLAYLSGAPERVGFASAGRAFPTMAKLTRRKTATASVIHEVEANLSLLHELGASPGSSALELRCSTEEERQLAELIAREQLDKTKPMLVFGVGASLPHKAWPADHFAQLAAHFMENKGWSVVVLGNENDHGRFGMSKGRFHNLAGQLSPNQSWTLLQQAALFVGNDSGAMHLAAAAGCPCVAILCSRPDENDTNPNAFRRFAPFGVPYAVAYPDMEKEGQATGVSFAKVLDTINNFPSTLDSDRARSLKSV